MARCWNEMSGWPYSEQSYCEQCTSSFVQFSFRNFCGRAGVETVLYLYIHSICTSWPGAGMR